MTRQSRLRVLAVDDVAPALTELAQLLRAAPEVDEVVTAGDPVRARQRVEAERFDAVFLDIAMPGLDGLEFAASLSESPAPPVIVFVTAYDEHAITAYGLHAVDYLLKPVRSERLATALTKVNRMVHGLRSETHAEQDATSVLPVASNGGTRYVARDDVHFVEAHGDHVRLHTEEAVHEVRMPMSRLEQHWEAFGFVRAHRGFLVALDSVRELRSDSVGGVLARTTAGDVPVSRRHTRELRERLMRAAQQRVGGRP